VNNVVHAYWWNYARAWSEAIEVLPSNNGTTINATLDDLSRDAGLLFEYAEKLDGLLAQIG